jgi:hypothetical protein
MDEFEDDDDAWMAEVEISPALTDPPKIANRFPESDKCSKSETESWWSF